MPSSPDNGEKKCRFGNSPFALIYNAGRIVTFTRAQVETAHTSYVCACAANAIAAPLTRRHKPPVQAERDGAVSPAADALWRALIYNWLARTSFWQTITRRTGAFQQSDTTYTDNIASSKENV